MSFAWFIGRHPYRNLQVFKTFSTETKITGAQCFGDYSTDQSSSKVPKMFVGKNVCPSFFDQDEDLGVPPCTSFQFSEVSMGDEEVNLLDSPPVQGVLDAVADAHSANVEVVCITPTIAEALLLKTAVARSHCPG